MLMLFPEIGIRCCTSNTRRNIIDVSAVEDFKTLKLPPEKILGTYHTGEQERQNNQISTRKSFIFWHYLLSQQTILRVKS